MAIKYYNLKAKYNDYVLSGKCYFDSSVLSILIFPEIV